MNEPTKQSDSTSRRQFLQTSATLAAGVAGALSIERSAHAAGNDQILKVGLIGCGGRGTGAAENALNADPNVRLTAMGDLFEDRLQYSLAQLRKKQEIADKIKVEPEQCFVGFDAYKKVIDSGVDVVLLCEPPHFRPKHLKAAIEAGKHVFAEKPVAVDAPGVRSVLATCEEARKKNLSVVSGLCMRYNNAFRASVQQVHDGKIGEILALEASDFRGTIWNKPRQPDWTDMHWQTRNWYYFTWLSGDFNVEQHIHMLDTCAWLMKDAYPVKASGTGGRQVRTGPEFGNIFDHHSVVYEYANGVKLFSRCRQQAQCLNDVHAQVMASKGMATLSDLRVGNRLTDLTGKVLWKFEGESKNMYQVEHEEMFAGIRSGKPINNGDYMSKSTLLAIMGRLATYTGQEITWKKALDSKEDLTPERYEWGPIATPEIAMPGKTKFI